MKLKSYHLIQSTTMQKFDEIFLYSTCPVFTLSKYGNLLIESAVMESQFYSLSERQ